MTIVQAGKALPEATIPDSMTPKKRRKRRTKAQMAAVKKAEVKTPEKKTRKRKEVFHGINLLFDEYKISRNWYMRVNKMLTNNDLYEIYFVFDGILYGYKQSFNDPTLAVTVGTEYLNFRYKNKAKYLTL